MFPEESAGGPRSRSHLPLFHAGKPFYSLDEVCRITGKSEKAVKDLVREGQIREYRDAGRLFFKTEDLIKTFRSTEATSSIYSLGEANSLFTQLGNLSSDRRDRFNQLTELGAVCGAWVDKRNKGTTLEELRDDIHLAARALSRLLSDDYSTRLLANDIQRNQAAGLGRRVDELSKAIRLVTLSQINPKDFLRELPILIGRDNSTHLATEVALEQTMHIGSPNIEGGPGSQALLRTLQSICNSGYNSRALTPERKVKLKSLFEAILACSLTYGQQQEVAAIAATLPTHITGFKSEHVDSSEDIFALAAEEPATHDLVTIDDNLDTLDPMAITPPLGTVLDDLEIDDLLQNKNNIVKNPPPASTPKLYPEKACLLSLPPLSQQIEEQARTEAPAHLLTTNVPEHFASNWANHFLMEKDPLSVIIEEVANDANRKSADSLRLVIAESNEAIDKLGDPGITIGTFEVSKPSDNSFELFSRLFTQANSEFEGLFKRLKDNQIDASALIPAEHQRWNNLLARVGNTWTQRSGSPSAALKSQATSLLKESFGELRDHIEKTMLPTLTLLQEQLQIALETRISRLLEKL